MNNKDTHIKSLLLRFAQGKTNKDESLQVQRWLEENEENANFFLKIKKLWEEESHPDYISKPEIAAEWSKVAPQLVPERKRLHLKSLSKIAAAVILFIGVTTLFYQNYYAQDTFQEYITESGERKQITLDDGTIVWLNASGKLTVDQRFGRKERRVSLVGEAWFGVAKNQKKPFIVSANEINIKVHGTQFNVDAYEWEETVKTSLEEGSISLYTEGGEPIMLVPGDIAEYVKAEHSISLIKESTDKLSDWRRGILHLEHLSLGLTLRRIENHFGVEILCSENFSGKDEINLTIENESAEEAIALLECITNYTFTLKE